MSKETSKLLSLLYLASPALPIGAFAYSQGLEKAIELELVHDGGSLKRWCHDYLQHGMSKLDAPLLLSLQSAALLGNWDDFAALNADVYAYRESAELLAEEENLGTSLMRLLNTQKLLDSLSGDMTLPANISYLAAYALAGAALSMSREELSLSLLWSWLENQTVVACKTIPLGQSDAQAILLGSRPLLEKCVDIATSLEQSAIGASLPGQAMLSALHETQYSRLFRS